LPPCLPLGEILATSADGRDPERLETVCKDFVRLEASPIRGDPASLGWGVFLTRCAGSVDGRCTTG
jgi:hypothetical protein